ncbi:MAG: hypothetical protein Q8N53_18270 [Longimicrobiales bacterium]|nr:hypothetical protein [Longimicrobiales bacterium]
MKATKSSIVWAGAVLLGAALLLPAGAAGSPVAELVGGGLGSALGCIGCGAAGLLAVWAGATLASILWSRAVFAASAACIGVCAAALTL